MLENVNRILIDFEVFTVVVIIRIMIGLQPHEKRALYSQ